MIKKIMDLIASCLTGMEVRLEIALGLVIHYNEGPRFQPLNQAGTDGLAPKILYPAVLVFEKLKGLDIRIFLEQKMPAVVPGIKLPLAPSGYEFEIRGSHLIVRRFLWPGDYDESEINPAVLEEIKKEFNKILLLYCQDANR